jgi:hypothetical protein
MLHEVELAVQEKEKCGAHSDAYPNARVPQVLGYIPCSQGLLPDDAQERTRSIMPGL